MTGTRILWAVLLLSSCARIETPVHAAQADGNPYTDSARCAECHAAFAKTYAQTGMARAFYKPGHDSVPNPQPYLHPASDTWFEMTSRDGAWYQRWWQIGPRGQRQSEGESKVDYVMGSGNAVRTYLHRTARGTLVELPLAWYAEGGGTWALNPGFDSNNPPIGRKIGYDCMFCHNAYPAIPPAHEHAAAEPVFTGELPQGIDCQRCHGPGARHIDAARQPNPNLQDIRASIVNPGPSMEVCTQCHLETTSRPLPSSIRRYDRGPFSYRPGEPLANFQLFFDHAPKTGHDDKFEIVNSVYRLRQSKCFLASAGKLTCTTCHNPHDIEHGESATTAYNKTCAGCHSNTKAHPNGAGNCVECHMPKRRSEDVVHAVMTDHLIQRRAPANPLAPLEEKNGAQVEYRGEVVPYGTKDDLYTAVAQVMHGSNLQRGIARLQAEIARTRPQRPEFQMELGDALQRAGRPREAATAYRAAIAKQPDSAILYARLAMPLRALGQAKEPLDSMRKAVQLDPDNPEIRYNLGLLESNLGDKTSAIATFRKAIELDPGFANAHASLGATLIETGDPASGEAQLREALKHNPTSQKAHTQLAYLHASRDGDLDQSDWHFQRAEPSAVNHFSHAITLARMNRLADAQVKLEASLKLDPKQPIAHELLGRLLAANNRLADAAMHYREALRQQPNFGQAHASLGTLLAQQGNKTAAAAEFRLAQSDPDPQVRQQATQGLAALGLR